MGVRVLVVDDEEPQRAFLGPLLTRHGYAVCEAATGADALECVETSHPDLVLLDVGLPDILGLEVCQRLRRRGRYLPVIMVTAWDTPADELAGLRASADDYVVKPFAPETLLARIEAVLRRCRALRARRVRLGADVLVDLDAREISRRGRALGVRAREFDLLAFLVEHPGQVFGAHQLLRAVWAGQESGTNAVAVNVSRLRTLIEDHPSHPRLLCTRWGVGYYVPWEVVS